MLKTKSFHYTLYWCTVSVWNLNLFGFQTPNNCSVSKQLGFQNLSEIRTQISVFRKKKFKMCLKFELLASGFRWFCEMSLIQTQCLLTHKGSEIQAHKRLDFCSLDFRHFLYLRGSQMKMSCKFFFFIWKYLLKLEERVHLQCWQMASVKL